MNELFRATADTGILKIYCCALLTMCLLSFTYLICQLNDRDDLTIHIRHGRPDNIVAAHRSHPRLPYSDARSTAVVNRNVINISVAGMSKIDGKHALVQRLSGMVFHDGIKLGSVKREIEARVVWSLVRSFSPEVDDRVRDMFKDEHGECTFFAIIPAIIRRNRDVLMAQRVWLAQYERRSQALQHQKLSMDGMNENWKNTWQENYMYYMRMNENYEAIEPGEFVGIPTTTNIKFAYKSDGVMDPRFLQVGDELLLLFHTWLVDKNSNDTVGGRVNLWNWDKRVKRKLNVPGLSLLRTEINWIPMDINGSLYLTYTLDPLRVMQCVVATGDCKFIFQQSGFREHPFAFNMDHLRGGTPFIVYKYPYYIGVGHSVGSTRSPLSDFSVYSTHLIVLCVNPWRVVYVSRHIEADGEWLKSKPVVRNHTIIGEFWYPMGIIMWSNDVIDVSCHLNDYNGHVVRLRGIASIMNEVMLVDVQNVASGATVRGAQPRVIQQYTLEILKLRKPEFTFHGDLVTAKPV